MARGRVSAKSKQPKRRKQPINDSKKKKKKGTPFPLPLDNLYQILRGRFDVRELFRLREVSKQWNTAVQKVLRLKSKLVLRLHESHPYVHSRIDERKNCRLGLFFADDQEEFIKRGGWEENHPVDVAIPSRFFENTRHLHYQVHVFDGVTTLFTHITQLTLRFECKYEYLRDVRLILRKLPKLQHLTVFLFNYADFFPTNRFDIDYCRIRKGNKMSHHDFDQLTWTINRNHEDEDDHMWALKRLEIFAKDNVEYNKCQMYHSELSAMWPQLEHFASNCIVPVKSENDLLHQILEGDNRLTHITLEQNSLSNVRCNCLFDPTDGLCRDPEPRGTQVTHLRLLRLDRLDMAVDPDEYPTIKSVDREMVETFNFGYHFPNLECLQIGDAKFADWDDKAAFVKFNHLHKEWFEQLSGLTRLRELKLFNVFPWAHEHGLTLPQVTKLTICAKAILKRSILYDVEYKRLDQVIEPTNRYYNPEERVDYDLNMMDKFPGLEKLVLIDLDVVYKADRAYVLYTNGTFKRIQGDRV